MLHPKRWLHHQRRQIAVIGSLAFATAVCVALLAVRAVYARSATHFGLLWNLFLAWLPMLCALAAYNLGRRRQRGLWLLIAPCLAFWLLFFPNAPYILTDIMHLQPQTGVPLWYDLILLVTFAWTGAFLGLISLYLMQSLVRRATGTWGSWVFTLAVLGLTGFGVYLGRFPRWNSWDVLTDPLSLLLDIGTRLRHPLAYSRTFVFSALFSLCLAAMYFMLTAIIQLRPEEAPHTGERERTQTDAGDRVNSVSIKNVLWNTAPLLIVLGAVLLGMPIVQWGAGQQGPIAVVIVGVLLLAALAVLYLAQAAETRRATAIVSTISVLAWAVETLGSKTGVPFGAYSYTEQLQPQLFGVPLLIPLAWLMMLPPAWAVAQRITGRVAGPAFIAVSALAFTAWDLYLDPQMVHWGLWVWDAPGAYFGIPLVNFAGWLLVSGLITALARPPALPQALLITYALVWLIEVIGQVVFWGLPGPALCGFTGMGAFLVWAWRSRANATLL